MDVISWVAGVIQNNMDELLDGVGAVLFLSEEHVGTPLPRYIGFDYSTCYASTLDVPVFLIGNRVHVGDGKSRPVDSSFGDSFQMFLTSIENLKNGISHTMFPGGIFYSTHTVDTMTDGGLQIVFNTNDPGVTEICFIPELGEHNYVIGAFSMSSSEGVKMTLTLPNQEAKSWPLFASFSELDVGDDVTIEFDYIDEVLECEQCGGVGSWYEDIHDGDAYVSVHRECGDCVEGTN